MTDRPTTAQIASMCDYVLHLEAECDLALSEGTTDGDERAAALIEKIDAWWAQVEIDVEQKAEAALYVLANAEGELAGLKATLDALSAPLKRRIKAREGTIERIRMHVLPTLVRVYREQQAAENVAIDTPLGGVRLAMPSNPPLVGPEDPHRWPARFTKPVPLKREAARYYKDHPEEMERDGFAWGGEESIRIFR